MLEASETCMGSGQGLTIALSEVKNSSRHIPVGVGVPFLLMLGLYSNRDMMG
jgi:hypothetical protein